VDVADDAELAKLEEKGVRARYASVERLQEVDGGKVHWQMATSSTPGGMIPPFIAEMSIDSQISAVKSHILHFVCRHLKSACRMSLTSSSGSTVFAPNLLLPLQMNLDRLKKQRLLHQSPLSSIMPSVLRKRNF